MSAQPSQRWDGCIGECSAARVVAAIAIDDLGAERLLALEMIIEGALWHTGRGGNVLDAGAVKALFNQDLEPGVHDFLAYIGSRHKRLI